MERIKESPASPLRPTLGVGGGGGTTDYRRYKPNFQASFRTVTMDLLFEPLPTRILMLKQPRLSPFHKEFVLSPPVYQEGGRTFEGNHSSRPPRSTYIRLWRIDWGGGHRPSLSNLQPILSLPPSSEGAVTWALTYLPRGGGAGQEVSERAPPDASWRDRRKIASPHRERTTRRHMHRQVAVGSEGKENGGFGDVRRGSQGQCRSQSDGSR